MPLANREYAIRAAQSQLRVVSNVAVDLTMCCASWPCTKPCSESNILGTFGKAETWTGFENATLSQHLQADVVVVLIMWADLSINTFVIMRLVSIKHGIYAKIRARSVENMNRAIVQEPNYLEALIEIRIPMKHQIRHAMAAQC